MTTGTVRRQYTTGPIKTTTTLKPTTCASCGIAFGLPKEFMDARQGDGRAFYCPNGHELSWHETEADRLRKRLEEADRRRARAETRATAAEDQAQAAERSARAYRGVATRVKNRAAAGVCPVAPCRRHFTDLQSHMASEHPEYPRSEDEEHPHD
jgi:hypothetical protein